MTHHSADKGRDNHLPFLNPKCLQTKIERGASVTGCYSVFNAKVFSYGLEQIIDKAVFDRVGRSIYKWWLIKIPGWILQLRSLLLSLLTLGGFTKHSNLSNGKKNGQTESRIKPSPYPFPLTMNKMIASLARNQLRKLDTLNHNRVKISKKIIERLKPAVSCSENYQLNGVYSFIVMKFENTILQKIIDHCSSRGLLLRPTWPTHQKLWDEQTTPAVRTIGENILTWTVNPMLTQKEINKFADIINNLPLSGFRVQGSGSKNNQNITAENAMKKLSKIKN